MRVSLCLEQCLAPVPGGTGRYSRELAAALARTAPAGSTVTGWTARHRDLGPATIEGVLGPRTFTLPRRALVAAWERGVGPAIRGADLVHAPTLLIPPRRGRPLVVTIHDTVPWTHPDTLTRRGVAWHRKMGRYAAKVADLILTPTQAVAGELAELFPTISGRTLVLSEGVSAAVTELPPDADSRAALLDLPEDGYVMSLATLEPRKGLDVLIAALAEPGAPKLPLLVVGQPGWGGVDPYAEAARHGLPADRLRLLGRLDDADLAVVLRHATVLVVPSRAEGFGLPVVEAMAVGTPVLSTDAPALVETGGGATRVVSRDAPGELADALSDIIRDESVRASLSAAGRVRAAEFSWDRSAQALWTAYSELAPGAA